EPRHQRDGTGALHGILGHELRCILARHIVQDCRVLDDCAFVDHQRWHASARVDLEVFRRLLLVLRKRQCLRVVLRAAFLQPDMRGGRTGAWGVVKLEHLVSWKAKAADWRCRLACDGGTRGRSSPAFRRRIRRYRPWRRSLSNWTAGMSPCRRRRSAPWL